MWSAITWWQYPHDVWDCHKVCHPLCTTYWCFLKPVKMQRQCLWQAHQWCTYQNVTVVSSLLSLVKSQHKSKKLRILVKEDICSTKYVKEEMKKKQQQKISFNRRVKYGQIWNMYSDVMWPKQEAAARSVHLGSGCVTVFVHVSVDACTLLHQFDMIMMLTRDTNFRCKKWNNVVRNKLCIKFNLKHDV